MFNDRYFTTGVSDSMRVGPFCFNSCENCVLPNRSLSFDGVDDYIEIPNSSELSGMGTLSVQAWVKKTSNSSSGTIISKFGSGGSNGSNYSYSL